MESSLFGAAMGALGLFGPRAHPPQDLRIKISGDVNVKYEMGPHRLVVPFGPIGTREFPAMANPTLTLQDDQWAQIGPVTEGEDVAGNSVPLNGPIQYSNLTPDVLDGFENVDGSYVVVPTGHLGTGQVQLTDGLATVVVDVPVIVSGEVSFNVPLGQPQDGPPPTPPAAAPAGVSVANVGAAEAVDSGAAGG